MEDVVNGFGVQQLRNVRQYLGWIPHAFQAFETNDQPSLQTFSCRAERGHAMEKWLVEFSLKQENFGNYF